MAFYTFLLLHVNLFFWSFFELRLENGLWFPLLLGRKVGMKHIGVARNLLILLALLSLGAGCGRESAPQEDSGGAPSAGASRPNVLLVTIDTLRADRVGCYGHAGADTPVMDGLAARGVRFATAVAHVPLTGPSHASLLTGRSPLAHGFRDNGGYTLPPGLATAAEEFRGAGYDTAAFVSAFPLDRRFGFDRGFETYDDHLPKGNDPRRPQYIERLADDTTDVVLRWLETRVSAPNAVAQPFFLWVHYYDPHSPYEPPGELAERFRRSPYDGEVAFTDRQLGRLLRALDERGEAPHTVVLVTSDHGEGLGDHAEGTHGLFVYDSTIKVPWIMAGPEIEVGRVAETVARGIDLLPTLLDYAGLPARPDLDGRSLRPAAEGLEVEDAPAYIESIYAERQFGWAPLFAWRTARYKLIEAPTPELYDLEADPGETSNRAAEEADHVAELQRRLEGALSQATPTAAAEVDPETAERLAALGYLGGGGASTPGTDGPRDPKEGVRLVPHLNRGMSAVRTDPALAIRELSFVLEEDPGLLLARRSLAVAYASSRKHDDAIRELRLLEKDGHLSAEDGIVLGDNLRFSGRLDEAVEVLEQTARENPKFVQPWLSLAEVHIRRQRLGEAAAAYDHVLDLVPDHIEALRGLGDLALLQERVEAARRRYARILEVDPDDAAAMAKLGVVSMRMRSAPEAIALFRRAVQREPENAEALLYLAGALASTGQPAEALPYFERALAAGERSAMALNGLALTRLALGDHRGAAQAFRESLRVDPDQPDLERKLAEIDAGGPSD
jgi:arylsulfatase A-like enzyme/cytochrome c-type biogenesis protein CcmH/NrfG